MKVLFLTDSLSLPRDAKMDKVDYFKTYPYLLKKRFKDIHFIFLGIGGATVKELYRQASYYINFSPDLVFFQYGIVDCAPRPFRKIETKIINKLRLRFLFYPFVRLLVKYRKYRYVQPKEFNYLTTKLANSFFNKSNVYSIGILPASDEYEKKLPGIKDSINTYNKILEKNYIFINNMDFPMNGILSDHHHLNAKGHQIIFEKISKIIESI